MLAATGAQEGAAGASPISPSTPTLPRDRRRRGALPAGPRPQPGAAHRPPTFLPEGPRFAARALGPADRRRGRPLAWAFGALGVQDRAKHLASLYLDDLADVHARRRGPALRARRATPRSWPPAPPTLRSAAPRRWPAPPTLVDELTATPSARRAGGDATQPDLVRLTVPFPGNVYGAFRIAQAIKAARPRIAHRAGRRLRQHRAARADRAARVRLRRLRHARRRRAAAAGAARAPARASAGTSRLLRTFVREDGARRALRSTAELHDIPLRATSARPPRTACRWTTTCRCWTCSTRCTGCGRDGRWNKLTVAHGCYWKKCSFCDVTLDYIARYEAAAADRWSIASRRSSRETGQTGFHFVDEAAPPAALRALAERLHRAQRRDHLVGQHPLREDLHARAVPSCWRDRGCIAVTRRAGGGLRSPARS